MTRRPAQLRRPKRSAPAAPPRPVHPDPESLQVVIWPAPVLKRIARPVTKFDPWLDQVIDRMIALMIEHEGVGLAAPQVGLPFRLFIMSPTGKVEDARAVINPVISMTQGQEEKEEGCLSLPEIRAKINRHLKLELSGLGRDGAAFTETLEGYPARIVQHENDHLDGILILDRMSALARMSLRQEIRKLQRAAENAGDAA